MVKREGAASMRDLHDKVTVELQWKDLFVLYNTLELFLQEHPSKEAKETFEKLEEIIYGKRG